MRIWLSTLCAFLYVNLRPDIVWLSTVNWWKTYKIQWLRLRVGMARIHRGESVDDIIATMYKKK